MKNINIDNLRENALKAQKIEDKRKSEHDDYMELLNLKSTCVNNGICPNCGNNLTATSSALYYGMFKRKKFYSDDVGINCTKCDFMEKSWPVEDLCFKVHYE